MESGNLKLLVQSTDMSIGRNLRKRGQWGADELARIGKLTSKDSTVAFVGAHVGALAIPTAQKVKKAYLIEANPTTYKLLEANLKINGIDNAVAFNCAVGEDEGEINFFVIDSNSGGSKREPANKEKRYFKDTPETAETVKVQMRRMDDLIINPDEILDLVLMDIEGSEYFALKGMQQVLANTRHLAIEFIGDHLKYISQATVSDFVSLIKPHFEHLYVPSTKRHFSADQFESSMSELYEKEIRDDGIIFSKHAVKFD